MLILMRRTGECIRIGEDITIKIVSVDRSRVRVGVEAPRHVCVDRLEVAEKKRLGVPHRARMAVGAE